MYYYQCLYHTSIIQVSTYQNIGKYLDSETPIYFVGLISKGVLKRLFFCFLCQPGEPEIAAKMFNSQYTPLTWLKKVVTFLKTDRKWMSLYKWPLYDHSRPLFCHFGKLPKNNSWWIVIFRPYLAIFASFMFKFHKTEVLMVILRCLLVLNLDWV